VSVTLCCAVKNDLRRFVSCECAGLTTALPKSGKSRSKDGFRVIGNGIDTLSDV